MELKSEEILQKLIADVSDDGVIEFENKIDFSSNESWGDLDIPVVVLSGFEPSSLLHLAKSLRSHLKADDYNVCVALEHPDIASVDMVPIHIELDLVGYVQKMCAYFDCEIVLLGFSPSIPPERYPEASLWIWGMEQDYEVLEGQVGITVKNESGQEVYEKMLSILL
jgi:hypothetical protein